MADFTIDTAQLRRLERSLSKAGVKYENGARLMLKRIGVLVQGLARKYCPESPTIGQYAKMNKSGKTKRKRSSITTGSLRDSITHEAKKDYVSINVPSNSRGGGYAEKIHDKKGKSWKKRGVRTKQKGPKADEKFIYRAFADSEKEIDGIVDGVIDDLTKAIGV